ncbi:hypothetical protein CA233_20735 [Sphingomonas sp. ABOLD]|uniref:DUF2946 family protein n=2 Tax=Sphingomonas TaxID=13687 RepID=A0A7X6BE71_9SPHN|nr:MULTISPECIES: DUF2946 family protein [Sphingomonas]NJB98477.1 hypothetical protein [Sphingomonas trueperi]RSV33876.1 hypothetical protein CA234_22100 [Sphingomonas sp. ABOLE]RSV39674.1 hypothetical protein CA233_20735 [Sphingomonas sp. ABOLD]
MRVFRIPGLFVRLLPALLLAFALCWQAGIVRAHVHPAQGWAATPHAHHAPKQNDDDEDCPLCDEVASAAAYLAATPPTVVPPLPARAWHAALAADPAPRLVRSHAWRSRAPPELPA